ncbi:DUF1992 domain-containing protein [Marimonas arenosa]|uniref:DUF1992 domain-containing protein n=2 Tax=Marimonas arenosa TaxID=1795305 RepID=A0AAE4B891_9RHOB|nr:DUF1992 domain-containing protein [Marimonas arenosa]
MSRSLRNLTEAQIRKAQAQGKLDHLEGEGKPLPHRPGDALIDPGTAIGHRIMAEHGALPEEIKLKKELAAARDAWQAATDPAEKKRLMAEIARLDLAYNIAVEARRKFLD